MLIHSPIPAVPVLENGYFTCTLPAGKQTMETLFEKTFGEMEFSKDAPIHGIVSPEDMAAALKVLEENTSAKNSLPFEFRLRYYLDNGKIAWLLCKGKLRHDAETQLPIMEMCCMDISRIIERKSELARQNEQKGLILSEISAGVWEWNFELHTEWWSDKFFDLLGLKNDEGSLTRQTFIEEFVHPDDRLHLRKAIDTYMHTRESFHADVRIRNAEGEYRWFETAGRVQLDYHGNPVRMVGTIIDKHEPKMMRMQLERNEFLLNETGSMGKIGGWEFNLQDGTVNWTREVYMIHELPLTLEPTYEVVKGLYDEESSRLLSAAVDACIREQKEYDIELVGLTSTGKRKWLRAIGKPVTDGRGNVVYIRGVVQDIDEKKKKELETEQYVHIIDSQNQRLNNYAHIVSHNLRTHAGNIDSILTMIGETEDEEERKELMTHLYKISAGLNETIEHLNTVARIQIDIQAARVKMRFADVFGKTVGVLLQNIHEAGVTLTEDFSQLEEIEYLPAYLESVMLNLLSNAIKYRHPERKAHITVCTFSKDNKEYLQVTDNGLGIDLARYGGKLFGMYKTFHRHPDAKGLGLFLTKNQVEALGGSIHVASEPGTGSTFTVQF